MEDDPYIVSDERLAEIQDLIDWAASATETETIPKRGVTVYDLADAVYDLLAERGGLLNHG